MSKKPGQSILHLIGNTPLLRLDRLSYWLGDRGRDVTLLAKAEFANPGGSVKDRAAWSMIRAGIRDGLLTHNKIILDSSSGNTGASVTGCRFGSRDASSSAWSANNRHREVNAHFSHQRSQ